MGCGQLSRLRRPIHLRRGISQRPGRPAYLLGAGIVAKYAINHVPFIITAHPLSGSREPSRRYFDRSSEIRIPLSLRHVLPSVELTEETPPLHSPGPWKFPKSLY